MIALKFSAQAKEDMQRLVDDAGLAKRLKAVRKALGFLSTNPRHQSLNTHEYNLLKGANGEKCFEAYAENGTPAAYRIFWNYGPGANTITILTVGPHP